MQAPVLYTTGMFSIFSIFMSAQLSGIVQMVGDFVLSLWDFLDACQIRIPLLLSTATTVFLSEGGKNHTCPEMLRALHISLSDAGSDRIIKK